MSIGAFLSLLPARAHLPDAQVETQVHFSTAFSTTTFAAAAAAAAAALQLCLWTLRLTPLEQVLLAALHTWLAPAEHTTQSNCHSQQLVHTGKQRRQQICCCCFLQSSTPLQANRLNIEKQSKPDHTKPNNISRIPIWTNWTPPIDCQHFIVALGKKLPVSAKNFVFIKKPHYVYYDRKKRFYCSKCLKHVPNCLKNRHLWLQL